MYSRRLVLKNTLNTRELGGYRTENGGITNYARFLRSDTVSRCDAEDIALLKAYGVRTVIDFRGALERARHTNATENCEGIRYYNIPLISEEELYGEEFFMTGLDKTYIGIINNRTAVGKLFHVLAENLDGTILFHCTAGKDRTGVTSMLLYMLAGVPLLDIMADYQVSYTYNLPDVKIFKEENPEVPMFLLKTEPEWIETAYRYVMEHEGGIEKYLKSVGITDDEIKRLRSAIVSEEE